MEMRTGYCWTILLVVFSFMGCRDPYAEQEVELRTAFEQFILGLNETYSSKSMEAASQVATGEVLATVERDLTATGGKLTEATSIRVDVESLTNTEATAVVGYRYRNYMIDTNGQKIADEYWHYHSARVIFEYLDNTWKVSRIETIDWN